MRNKFLFIVLAVLLIVSCKNPFFPEKDEKEPEVQKTYGITLSSQGGAIAANYNFGSVQIGYAALLPKEVTITNTGNQATGDLTVSLSGADAGSFTVSPAAINSVAAGSTAVFTVVPNTGLAVKTYNAVVTVSGGNDISAGFNVAFTVSEEPQFGIALAEYSHTFPAAQYGYAALDFYPVIVTNTNEQIGTGVLTIGLSGANPDSFTLSANSITNIPATEGYPFTVSVKTGLLPGHYSATVTISGANGITASVTVSFNVDKKDITITGVKATDRAYEEAAGVGSKTVALSDGALNGVINNDSVGFTLGAGTIDNANVGNGKAVTTVIQLTGDDKDNYTLTQPNYVTVNITQAAGDAVAVPAIKSNTNTSITINAVAEPVSGQPVEYNISHVSNKTDYLLTTWQTSTTFTNLPTNKTYYIYARSANNGNYAAGEPSEASVSVTLQTFTLSVAEITNPAIPVTNSGLTIYRNSEPKTGTLAVSGAGYGKIEWWYDNYLLGENAALQLSASDTRYNMIGAKFVTVIVTIEGKPYSQRVWFNVQREEE